MREAASRVREAVKEAANKVKEAVNLAREAVSLVREAVNQVEGGCKPGEGGCEPGEGGCEPGEGISVCACTSNTCCKKVQPGLIMTQASRFLTDALSFLLIHSFTRWLFQFTLVCTAKAQAR